ncbi:MAG TPA: ABC transporter permease [Candidatus Dormibacteraeota bacterium]|jgi:peptide/nickel transport system permease protein|nr:ABC transporter permease [Candidatus Dormibacteraeota bacterium]
MKRSLHKTAVWLIFLAFLHVIVLAAGFVAPYDPVQQDRDRPYAPPMAIHCVDRGGKIHLRPFAYVQRVKEGFFDQYEEDRATQIPLKFFVKGAPYRLLGIIPGKLHLFGTESGSINLFGTDGYGRDLFSRILHGAQVSLFAGLLAASISLFLGVLMGGASGYFGGWTDSIVMRFAELCLVLPWLYLLFGVRAFLPLLVSPMQAFLIVVIMIGALGWARPARLVRGVALSAKERDFVRAARGFGASHFYILRRHILPQTRSIILTQAAILIPQYILAEVTLSFLGLGIPEPAPSWGNLLSSLQQYSVLSSYWWMYLPALAMVPFFFGYLALSSSLQEEPRAAKIGL